MKKLIAIVFSLFTTVSANCEFSFTDKQKELLFVAYGIGAPHDLGYTLAAITWQEGYIGERIVRVNPSDNIIKDGKPNPTAGAYGVTSVLLDTAMWLEGIESDWEAKEKLVPRMINDDVYVIRDLSLELLLRYKHLGWERMIGRYNVSSEYLAIVSQKVNRLMKCDYFGL